MKIIVTGGCGFIGSHLVQMLLKEGHIVVNYDALTYAADKEFTNFQHNNYTLFAIYVEKLPHTAFEMHEPDVVIHLAAESHVDNSISSPARFVETNVRGTFAALEATLWARKKNNNVHFVHVSTDEVYGSFKKYRSTSPFGFQESDAYNPSSPYAATKAASDHLVNTYRKTYGLRTTITHCTNNYGPRQHKEKFIPTVIQHILEDKPVPIYGDGKQLRDWLYVTDHCKALLEIVEQKLGKIDVLNISANNQMTNVGMASLIGAIVEKETGHKAHAQHVQDRPGHDVYYKLDSRLFRQLSGWEPKVSLEDGLLKTVRWYLEHQ